MRSSRVPGGGPGVGGSAQSGVPAIRKRAACAMIFSCAAVSVGFSVSHDVQTTASFLTPVLIHGAALARKQETCIYDLIRHEVPKGAAVYVNSPRVEWSQRLAELATLWAVPQPTGATALYRLSVARGDCYGVGLLVRRL